MMLDTFGVKMKMVKMKVVKMKMVKMKIIPAWSAGLVPESSSGSRTRGWGA